MIRRAAGCLAVIALLSPLAAAGERAQAGEDWTLQAMQDVNGGLKAQWMDLRVAQVEVLTIGQERATIRLFRQPARWVAADARRSAHGDSLTYLVEMRDGPNGGTVLADFETAIDRAIASWTSDPCLSKLGVAKQTDIGEDADIFDAYFGYGDLGNWQAADIVVGGWMPPSFFDAVVGEGGGASVLAMSVTFIFVGLDGVPTDVDGDKYFDTASNEIFFNDGFSWQLGGGLDVETVALHEIGHSLGVGHFGPPPLAAMNPVYTGAHPELMSWDRATVCSLWSSWPRR
jgi:hypothetical protein